MPRLWVDLAANLVDVETDPAPFIAADVVVTNSTGIIVVDNLGGSPRSVHRFSTMSLSSFWNTYKPHPVH